LRAQSERLIADAIQTGAAQQTPRRHHHRTRRRCDQRRRRPHLHPGRWQDRASGDPRFVAPGQAAAHDHDPHPAGPAQV